MTRIQLKPRPGDEERKEVYEYKVVMRDRSGKRALVIHLNSIDEENAARRAQALIGPFYAVSTVSIIRYVGKYHR